MLQPRAQEVGEQWVEEGRGRRIRGGWGVEELQQINKQESEALARAFVSK